MSEASTNKQEARRILHDLKMTRMEKETHEKTRTQTREIQ